MASARIPLIDAEALSIARQFQQHSMPCLTIVLQPPSLDAFRGRLSRWLTETERALAQYAADLRKQVQAVLATRVHDEVVVSGKLNRAIEDALAVAKKYRPDLFKDVLTGTAMTLGAKQCVFQPWMLGQLACHASGQSIHSLPSCGCAHMVQAYGQVPPHMCR
jgi:hypothetical protein